MQVTFPWPPKELSPNARVYWRAKAPHVQAYKAACWAETPKRLAQYSWTGEWDVNIVFQPPDLRGRDLDNMLASIKAGLDGMARAMGVNDRNFRIAMRVGPKFPKGRIIVSALPAKVEAPV